MADLAEHALEDGADLLLVAAADLAETERAQGAAMSLALADLAPDLGDLHLGHQSRLCFGWSSSRMTVFLSRLATLFAAPVASFATSTAASTTGSTASTTCSTTLSSSAGFSSTAAAFGFAARFG